MRQGETLSTAIRAAASRGGGGPALVPYITAGFPTKAALVPQLRALAAHAAVIEVGVPFSDPMVTGRRSSVRAAWRSSRV